MAAVSSYPVSSLPGSRHILPAGAMCDNHPDRPAQARVQGETDSFGCEYCDLCAECLQALAEQSKQGASGRCDWCTSIAIDLRPRRDYDEGMSGRVYQVCGECVRKENERASAELDEYDHW